MRKGKKLDESLLAKIKTSIRTARSARHVPAKVRTVLSLHGTPPPADDRMIDHTSVRYPGYPHWQTG